MGLADWAGPAEVGGAVGVVAGGQSPWKGQAAQLGMKLNGVGGVLGVLISRRSVLAGGARR